MAELLIRKPILPGESLLNQLNLILQLVGTPEESDLEDIRSERAKIYIQTRPKSEGVDFYKLFPNANPILIDLLQRLLVFNPVRFIQINRIFLIFF